MSVTLKVEEREVRPRSLRKQLRHEGKALGVVYGYKVESTPISFDEKELVKVVRDHGENVLVALQIGGKKVNTLINKLDMDIFTPTIKHVEFIAVKMDEETEVETDIVLVGESAGAKLGGFLSQTLFKVTVAATPDKLPERIEVDVTNLAIGDSITVADLPEEKDFRVVTEGDIQVAAVVESTLEADLEEIEEAEAQAAEADTADDSEKTSEEQAEENKEDKE
ncbi:MULTISPECIES: 50S ribosomal protein L25/general stress protein Ctc [Exiguobacterium]|uniref:Large ribosomal subunit protein bL25 n=1 Tax=Exiguobacterium antarcticum TaxID=132920 RepID=A0ABT6R5J3_9BACL|nr:MULTISPECIES: 50S ribosomal protein L25/general stress protein Ctc [Exiguobacterium]AFS70577.1 50S ribosomal protein L25 [Exiguobacterium antarcticum B7]MCT4780047.1 50S ribosomal protein L25/general stress protein Ctc [Exiguobacterium soli]MDI3236225.1 50S ribosomal protein L25/general stress protein Ctc [Exiguobacterium antarcticum]